MRNFASTCKQFCERCWKERRCRSIQACYSVYSPLQQSSLHRQIISIQADLRPWLFVNDISLKCLFSYIEHYIFSEKEFYRALIHLANFMPFCSRETTFVTSCLPSCTPSPFWKGTSKRKEFHLVHIPLWKGVYILKERICSQGQEILYFSCRPFFRRKAKQFGQSCPHESVSIPFM